MPDSYELRDSRSPSPTRNGYKSPRDSALSNRSSLDLNELDPLKGNGAYRDKEAVPSTSFQSYLGGDRYAWLKHRQGWKAWCMPSRMCCCMTLLFLTAVLLLMSTGGFWVYKVGGAAIDGQSDPWYPSPRGGTVREWADAYWKANEPVSYTHLTLPTIYSV